MKAIRWGGLVTFVASAPLIIAAALFSGLALKPVLESKFTDMNGAKVDIDAINIGYSPFTLEIDNIQVTDPSQPMINTAQIAQIRLALSFTRLLMGQLIIDDASIRGVRLETPRKKSGAIKQVEIKNIEKLAAKESNFDIPGIDFPSVSELVDKESLQSDLLLDNLSKDLDRIDKQWTKARAGLPDREKINNYDKRYSKIQQDSKAGATQKIAAIKEAKNLINEITADIELLKQAKTQFSDDIDHINQNIKEVNTAPAKDIARIKSKYNLDAAGAENVAEMLFGDAAAAYLAMARKWYGRIEPYIASDKEVEPVIDRSKGIDVVFKEKDPKPDVYVQLASITADLPHGTFEGEITDISSDQSINKKPMGFILQGVALVGRESEAISGEFNYVDKHNSITKLNYSLSKAQLEPLTISRSRSLPLEMKTASISTSVNAHIQKGILSGTAKTQFRQVNFATSSSSIFASAFQGIKAFDVDAIFKGAVDDLSIQINSDLDKQLGQQLKAQFAQKRQKFEAELKARIDEKLSGPMARIDAKKKKLDGLKQGLDDSENRLQEKLAALNKIAAQQTELKTDNLKEKIKTNLN